MLSIQGAPQVDLVAKEDEEADGAADILESSTAGFGEGGVPSTKEGVPQGGGPAGLGTLAYMSTEGDQTDLPVTPTPQNNVTG